MGILLNFEPLRRLVPSDAWPRPASAFLYRRLIYRQGRRFGFRAQAKRDRGVGLCPVKANSLSETDVLEGRLFCLGDRQGRGVGIVSNLRLLHQAVSIASANTKLFKILADEAHFDGAPATIGVGLRVVTQRV